PEPGAAGVSVGAGGTTVPLHSGLPDGGAVVGGTAGVAGRRRAVGDASAGRPHSPLLVQPSSWRATKVSVVFVPSSVGAALREGISSSQPSRPVAVTVYSQSMADGRRVQVARPVSSVMPARGSMPQPVRVNCQPSPP